MNIYNRIFLKLLSLSIITSGLFYNVPIFATDKDLGPWSVMFYAGGTAKQSFAQVITGNYSNFGEVIYTAEVAYTLNKNNLVRRVFRPLFIDTVQVAGNFTYRHDYAHNDNIEEENLYLIWRWTKFPWEHYMSNSLAIGDGISYDSSVPFVNRNNQPANNYSKLLNYLILEATFATPSNPQLQLVLRMHHTCTAWGTFPKKANAGSTNIGLGIRYYF